MASGMLGARTVRGAWYGCSAPGQVFPTIAVPLYGANVRIRFGFGRTVYGNHASSAVCGLAGAVGKPYLDGRTRKSPVHSPSATIDGAHLGI